MLIPEFAITEDEKSAINVSESKFVFINTPYNFLYRHNFK